MRFWGRAFFGFDRHWCLQHVLEGLVFGDCVVMFCVGCLTVVARGRLVHVGVVYVY